MHEGSIASQMAVLMSIIISKSLHKAVPIEDQVNGCFHARLPTFDPFCTDFCMGRNTKRQGFLQQLEGRNGYCIQANNATRPLGKLRCKIIVRMAASAPMLNSSEAGLTQECDMSSARIGDRMEQTGLALTSDTHLHRTAVKRKWVLR